MPFSWLDTRYWMLDAGYRMLDTRLRVMDGGYSVLDVKHIQDISSIKYRKSRIP